MKETLSALTTSLTISKVEFEARTQKLLEHIRAERLSGVVLFDNYYILYYTGFAFIPTERPIALVMNARGETALFVPRLEREHAQSNARVDRVDEYSEYPSEPHPMELFKKRLKEMGIVGAYGADTDGYPWALGYRGPTLTELLGSTPRRVTAFIEDQMMIKSPSEIARIKESVKWGNLAHQLLQRYTRVGATETEVSQRASAEATLAMLGAIGPIYRAHSPFAHGAHAGYRGQIGRNAAIPHALAANIVFQPGDVLVTGANAPVWGYNSELERTMILGRPSDEQRECFEHMLALQETALRAMRPGVRCSDVDRAVRQYYEEHRLMSYWKHHVG
ncbi:MAG: Xaa-Pro peptidase family protein, partial [Candidatus Bipolaricaulota bacterium]|nr:Xaa-Pro peptidase family protein [Candidatus Bipolaricaulota bacterium]